MLYTIHLKTLKDLSIAHTMTAMELALQLSKLDRYSGRKISYPFNRWTLWSNLA